MQTLDARFFKPFVDGALRTLEVTCSVKATSEKPFIKGTQPQPEFAIAGVIGITSPKFNGTITLCFPEKVFLEVMSKMLGEKYTSITNELTDGVAELLNIIYGQAKSVLNQQGYSVEKAIPTVVKGAQLQTSLASQSKAMVLPFKTEVGEFHIEICSESLG
jgi:chemotaxis protein CheX